MRLAAPIICVLIGLALASSGGAAVNALVVGKLMSCGASGSRCSAQEHAVVSVFNSQHRRVARESVTNGHFSFALRPGRFTLIATARYRTQAKRSVTARARRTVHANIVFHSTVPCCKH